ncbi:MAG: hypothetical protein K2I96_02385 [Lachnospiraceae bacterium]|nr:hypothetical protein [Lachnospiraceae bacterium]
MKKKFILIFMIVLAMGMTACSSESKGDAASVETDSRQETDKEEAADTKITETETNDVESSNPEMKEGDEKTSSEDRENTEGDPIAGIVEKYEGSTIMIRTPEDDILYYFSTENAQILEGFSTEDAQAVEGEPSIAVGDKVEISYRGLIDFDEEHPSEAVKIVVITVE